jgi:hypothetical protein
MTWRTTKQASFRILCNFTQRSIFWRLRHQLEPAHVEMSSAEILKRLKEAEDRLDLVERERLQEREKREEAEAKKEEAEAKKEEAEAKKEEAEAKNKQEREKREEAEAKKEEAEAKNKQEREKREEAEAKNKQEREKREEAEAKNKRLEREREQTTLLEYLMACHDHMATKVVVETNKSLTTTGFTNVDGKRCPASLEPWSNFLSHRNKVLRRLLKAYPTDSTPPQPFPTVEKIKGIGEDLEGQRIASESDLVTVHQTVVERPVVRIINHLKTIPAVRDKFHLDDGIIFNSNRNILKNDDEDEMVEQLEQHRLSPSKAGASPATSEHNSSSSSSSSSSSGYSSASASKNASALVAADRSARTERVLADQMCFHISNRNGTPRRTLAFLIEYKPPHKLTRAHLEEGLKERMEPRAEVIERQKIPAKEDESRFRYDSQALVAMTMTQTYNYMIKMGLEYSYITTGEAFVFLHIRKDEPSKLFYYLTEPDADVEQLRHDAAAESLLPLCGAVGQVLAFCLLALGSKPRDQQWRKEIVKGLDVWNKAEAADSSESDRKTPRSTKSQKPRRRSSYVSRLLPDPSIPPAVTRSKLRMEEPESCRAGSNSGRLDDSSSHPDSDPDDQRLQPTTPLPTRGGRRGTSQSSRGADGAGRRGGTGRTGGTGRSDRNQSYCTQACLSGLVFGKALDRSCPNVCLHRINGHHNGFHAIDRKTLLILLRAQLAEDLDDGCQNLDIRGSRGALFRVRLNSYGYTMVGKGTVASSARYLRHEFRMYERLKALQGVCIPVCLGNVDLIYPYYYLPGADIVHMLFLAWAGGPVKDFGEGKMATIDMLAKGEEVIRSLKAVHLAGVIHNDVRQANVLWSGEKKRAMLIDFERSTILPTDRSNRKRGTKGKVNSGKEWDEIFPQDGRIWRPFWSEMISARVAFTDKAPN